jgi:putative flavoprotein involved in K+ transport
MDGCSGSSPVNGSSQVQQRHVVVVGGGQAGLSVAHALQKRGIRPLVLEKNRIGYAWDQQRWDSFCLVTPNWQCQLPDFPYDGSEPEGFMVKSEIVSYLQRFAGFVGAELREGVAVQRLVHNGPGYRLLTSEGEILADHVVVATGGYHIPRRHAESPRRDSSHYHRGVSHAGASAVFFCVEPCLRMAACREGVAALARVAA